MLCSNLCVIQMMKSCFMFHKSPFVRHLYKEWKFVIYFETLVKGESDVNEVKKSLRKKKKRKGAGICYYYFSRMVIFATGFEMFLFGIFWLLMQYCKENMSLCSTHVHFLKQYLIYYWTIRLYSFSLQCCIGNFFQNVHWSCIIFNV